MDKQGVERCVRCLLPPGLAAGRPCRAHGTLGHNVYSLGKGIFCSRCGSYSFKRLELLAAACTGPPPKHGPTAWRLGRMIAGRDPKSGKSLGTPLKVDPARSLFSIVLGEPEQGSHADPFPGL